VFVVRRVYPPGESTEQTIPLADRSNNGRIMGAGILCQMITDDHLDLVKAMRDISAYARQSPQTRLKQRLLLLLYNCRRLRGNALGCQPPWS